MNLITIGISFAILGAAMTASLVGLKQYDAGAERHNIRQQRALLAKNLAAQVDCYHTFFPPTFVGTPAVPPASCSGAIPLRGRDAGLLADANGRLGNWQLQATCVTSGTNRGLQIKAALMGGNGGFRRNTSTEEIYDFNHPQATLFGNQLLCPNFFWGTAPPQSTPKFIQAASADIIASSCSSGYNSSKISCLQPFYIDVVFPQPFQSIPKVIVNAGENFQSGFPMLMYGGWGCSGNIDRLTFGATNITTTGFRMICASSRENSADSGWPTSDPNCHNTRYMRGTCRWLAVQL